MRPCPTCAGTHSGPLPRCPECEAKRRRASRERNGRDDQHYASTSWRKRRAAYLRRHPWCEHDGCLDRAQVVDHDPPRRQLVAAGVHDPDADEWLHGLCKPHHDHKTATVDGGFGRRADQRIWPLDLTTRTTESDR